MDLAFDDIHSQLNVLLWIFNPKSVFLAVNASFFLNIASLRKFLNSDVDPCYDDHAADPAAPQGPAPDVLLRESWSPHQAGSDQVSLVLSCSPIWSQQGSISDPRIFMLSSEFSQMQLDPARHLANCTYYQCCGSESGSGSTGSTCFWTSRIRIH